jgi:hypothetical protein
MAGRRGIGKAKKSPAKKPKPKSKTKPKKATAKPKRKPGLDLLDILPDNVDRAALVKSLNRALATWDAIGWSIVGRPGERHVQPDFETARPFEAHSPGGIG